MRGRPGALAATCGVVAAFVGALSAGAAEGVDAVPPEFAVRTADGMLHEYAPVPDGPLAPRRGYSIDDRVLLASVRPVGEGRQWELAIERANVEIREVLFPWSSKRTAIDDTPEDDVFYYPFLLGLAERATARDRDFDWRGTDEMTYPGGTSAPLAVLADPDDARIVAATNWPPRRVVPMYGGQRIVLRYPDPVVPGASASYRALIAEIHGVDTRHGTGWQAALDLYRAWLDSRMPRPEYPRWMWHGEGLLQVGLQNMKDFTVDSLASYWEPVREDFPWIQFWGQMSDYGGGCCELDQEFHPRYLPDLPRFLRSRAAWSGIRFGFYSAPYYGRTRAEAPLPLDSVRGKAWLEDWIERNRKAGANAFYVDTLGRRTWGDPEKVLELFRSGVIPEGALIEGIVDVYPAPGALSGALVGYDWMCGAPWKTVQDSSITTFPRFVRYLLADRMIFLGPANTDWIFWGATRNWDRKERPMPRCGFPELCARTGGCEHWVEREAFLLGARFNAASPSENPVLARITKLRREARWWRRRPVYLDTKGLDLSSVPLDARIEIRRFLDRSGDSLFAVYNGTRRSGARFRFEGQDVQIPSEEFSVLERRAKRRPKSAAKGEALR